MTKISAAFNDFLDENGQLLEPNGSRKYTSEITGAILENGEKITVSRITYLPTEDIDTWDYKSTFSVALYDQIESFIGIDFEKVHSYLITSKFDANRHVKARVSIQTKYGTKNMNMMSDEDYPRFFERAAEKFNFRNAESIFNKNPGMIRPKLFTMIFTKCNDILIAVIRLDYKDNLPDLLMVG